jgi:hypothetical protein
VIFTSQRTEGDRGYEAMAQAMFELALKQPGCLGAESVRDVLDKAATLARLYPMSRLGPGCVKTLPKLQNQ